MNESFIDRAARGMGADVQEASEPVFVIDKSRVGDFWRWISSFNRRKKKELLRSFNTSLANLVWSDAVVVVIVQTIVDAGQEENYRHAFVAECEKRRPKLREVGGIGETNAGLKGFVLKRWE